MGNHYILTACPPCVLATNLTWTRWNWRILDIRRQRQWMLVNIHIFSILFLVYRHCWFGWDCGFQSCCTTNRLFGHDNGSFVTTLSALQVVDDIFVRSVSNVGTPLYMAPEAFSLQVWGLKSLAVAYHATSSGVKLFGKYITRENQGKRTLRVETSS